MGGSVARTQSNQPFAPFAAQSAKKKKEKEAEAMKNKLMEGDGDGSPELWVESARPAPRWWHQRCQKR